MTGTRRIRVALVRGQQLTPWEVHQWTALGDRFEVTCLTSRSNRFDVGETGLAERRVWTMRDLLPPGRVGDTAVRAPGDRYIGLARALRGMDVVHAQELGYWYSMQAARLKPRLGFKLALTVWETLPFLDAYRNVRTRRYRRRVLDGTDVFLAATERARVALLLEGAAPERIRVSPPGIDSARFGRAPGGPSMHVVLSIGRLVWEKGHQDVMRALAALRREAVEGPRGTAPAELVIVGVGPEEARLRAYARELGIADAVSFRRWVRHDEIPRLYANASCLVLASLPQWHWEEQFGMVLAEALCAGLPIVASECGAIPEVLSGQATTFAPGDWIGLARALALGPLAGPPGERAAHDPELMRKYSLDAAAQRLAAAYDELLAGWA